MLTAPAKKRPVDTPPKRAMQPSDARFCVDMLPRVSRTFALSIAALPEALRDAVRVAYLLCRVVDTVEDDAELGAARRTVLFDAFDALMLDDALPCELFEQLSADVSLGKGTADYDLCCQAGAVFRCFRALDADRRAAIRPAVMEMSRGMRHYALHADAHGKLRLQTLQELERYCHYVAGTVGKLLTSLFELTVPELPEATRRALQARAISFGLALQLVNIVKDVAEDLPRGDCFLPAELADAHGVRLEDILNPDSRAAGLKLVRQVCARAREHLRRAQQYTLLWPAEGGAEVRLFCAVPLTLALSTLREVEHGDDTLVAGRTPKISRECVMAIFTEASRVAADDDQLRALFEYYAASVEPRPQPTERAASKSSSSAHARSAHASADSDDGLSRHRRGVAVVLVTGAAGHLGANLVKRLIADGERVRVLLRAGSDNRAMDEFDIDKRYGDLRDRDSLQDAMTGVSRVFHCAATVSTIQGDRRHKQAIFSSNVDGARNLLEVAREAGVERVVVTGSLEAIGQDLKDPNKPASEDQLFNPFAPNLPYSHTKLLVEHECYKAVADGLDVVIATSCAIIGPADYKLSPMGRTLLDFAHGRLRAYIPGGFEFVSADDIVQGHLLAMERGRKGQKYIFSTRFVAMDELMEMFEEVTGVPRPRMRLPGSVMALIANASSFVLGTFFPQLPQRFTPDAVRLLTMRRHADTSKARQELGYEPGDIRDAIQQAYDDFVRRGLVSGRSDVDAFSIANAPNSATYAAGARVSS